MFHERASRSVLKAMTWFVVEFVVTLIILLLITHNWQTALFDAVVINFVKIFFYYGHERLWNKTNFGQELRHLLHLDRTGPSNK
jgi:uncharacterized membrane protein